MIFREAEVDLGSAACASFSGAAVVRTAADPVRLWWAVALALCLRDRSRQAPHWGAFFWAWAGAGSSPPTHGCGYLFRTTTRRMPCYIGWPPQALYWPDARHWRVRVSRAPASCRAGRLPPFSWVCCWPMPFAYEIVHACAVCLLECYVNACVYLPHTP